MRADYSVPLGSVGDHCYTYQVYHHCLSVDVMGTAGTDNVVKNLHCIAHNHNDCTVRRRHTHNDAHYHFPEMIH